MGAASCSCVQSEAEPSATEPKVTLVYSEQRLSSGSKDGNDGGKVRERSKSKQKSFEVKPNGEVKNDVPSPFDGKECPKPGQSLNVCEFGRILIRVQGLSHVEMGS